MTLSLDALRARFPHTQHTVYLNHAATAPLSAPVVAAMDAFVQQRHGAMIDNYFAFQPTLEATREQLGRLIGTTAERVEFAPNTSYALDVLVRGLDWREGDRVAVPACEFPANVYPFLNLRDRGVAVDFIPHHEGTVRLEDIERTLSPRTRLLSISWVQFLSGFRADLEAVGRLCRQHDVIFCVDAIQGLGALHLDVEAAGIDFLACGGHKWVMAAQGTGFLYVRKALQEQLIGAAGWLHGPVNWDDLFEYDLSFHPTAERFRLGTLNGVGIAAMHAALSLYFEVGAEEAHRRVVRRARELAEGLRERGLQRYGTDEPSHASGIVTVHHPAAEVVHRALEERGVQIAVRNGLLRFAPTYYNSASDIQHALDAVDAALAVTPAHT